MKYNEKLKSHRRLEKWIKAGCLTNSGYGPYEKTWLQRWSEFLPYMTAEELKRVYGIAPHAKIHRFAADWLPNSREETKLGVLVPAALWGMTWEAYVSNQVGSNPTLDLVVELTAMKK